MTGLETKTNGDLQVVDANHAARLLISSSHKGQAVPAVGRPARLLARFGLGA